MNELDRRRDRTRDPDKTNPPVRVEDLWGGRPSRRPDSPRTGERDPDAGPQRDSAIPLSDHDAMALYSAARDCMISGAYSRATVLLRRLVIHMTQKKADKAGTREEAERLFALAELLLGRAHEPPSDHRSTDARDRALHRQTLSANQRSSKTPKR